MAGENQMTAAEKSELYDALRGIQTGTMDRKSIMEIQKRLKSKYPDTYGTVRKELGNQLSKTSNSKGKAITKEDIPVIAISVGMGKMKKKRASFKARHAKNIAKGKMSAAYWADKVKW